MSLTDTNEFYQDPCRYNRTTAALSGDAPIRFYKECARSFAGPVLELAAGTGRLAIPIAEGGTEIVALDASPAMLAEARRKTASSGLPVTWIEADMRHFDLRRQFRFIFIASNSLSHLYTREDIEHCLACVHRHLAPGGRFVIDVFNPAFRIFLRSPDERIPVTSWHDSHNGTRVEVSKSVRYDAAAQVVHETWFYSDNAGETKVPLQLRMFFPQELDALLHYNGFAVEHKYGSYEGELFNDASRKQIAVCINR